MQRSSCLLRLLLAFVHLQEGREDGGWQRPQQIGQVTGMIGREGAPGEPPGILMRTLQLGKTGQRPSQRIKAQFQGGGLDSVLLVFALPGRGSQDQHWQHVLIGRQAFRRFAPAQEAFQAQTH